MFFEVKVQTEDEDLNLFPDAEYSVTNASMTDPSSFELKHKYIHRWIVKSKNKRFITDTLLSLKLRSNTSDVRIAKKTKKQLEAEKARREILFTQDSNLDDVVKLSGISPLTVDTPNTITVFGKTLQQEDLNDIRMMSHNFIFTELDPRDPNLPDEGYVVAFPKLTAVEFEQRINLFRRHECGVSLIYYYRSSLSFVVLEQLTIPAQVDYKMRWDNPKDVYWFRNDSLDHLKKLAGIL